MGVTSLWHWIIVLLIIFIMFGAGKLPKVMGDLGEGIRNFKKGINGPDQEFNDKAKEIDEAKNKQ